MLRLAACDEESACLMQLEQPCEIQIAAIHDIKRAGFDGQEIEHAHLVHLAVADVDEGGDRAAQIQQRMHLDRRLGRAKRRPLEQGQAQVYRRGIERIDRRVEIDVQRLGCVKCSGAGDEPHGQRMIDAPVSQIQRVRQRRACRHVLQSHMKQLAPIRSQAGLDVAQGFAPGQLREGHDAEQIGAAKRAYTRVATVSLDDAAKRLPRHKLHDLRKQRLAHVHALPPVAQTRKDRKC